MLSTILKDFCRRCLTQWSCPINPASAMDIYYLGYWQVQRNEYGFRRRCETECLASELRSRRYSIVSLHFTPTISIPRLRQKLSNFYSGGRCATAEACC